MTTRQRLSGTLHRKSNWLETGIVEQLREELDIPVTHTVVDLATPCATVAR